MFKTHLRFTSYAVHGFMNLLLLCLFMRLQSPAHAATSVAAPKILTVYSYHHDFTEADGTVKTAAIYGANDRLVLDGQVGDFDTTKVGLQDFMGVVLLNHIQVQGFSLDR